MYAVMLYINVIPSFKNLDNRKFSSLSLFLTNIYIWSLGGVLTVTYIITEYRINDLLTYPDYVLLIPLGKKHGLTTSPRTYM